MSSIPMISDLLGYTSIACWLGAQFPQVMENLRRQSCEGLALPFLFNWLLGDFSNLVGCILTHQLPFQTYLATYFVIVDCTLVVQYFYYTGLEKKHKSTPSFGHPRSLPSASAAGRMSLERGAARYRTLSAVAANVAATAALAAQQDEQADQRRGWQRHSMDRVYDDRGGRGLRELADNDDVDESALAALADSFHSERGHETRRKRISWSIERYGGRGGSVGQLTLPQQLPSTDSLLDPTGRGRPLQRDLDESLELEPEVATPNRRNSRASRKGATMVFLSTWALFGIGTLAGSKHGVSVNTDSRMGRVLAIRGLGMPESIYQHNQPMHVTIEALQDGVWSYDDGPTSLPDMHIASDTFNERVIGRIFAWLCTTLYLTSRLPQIWKNFVRKSVEGLSMYLFVFAFLGNVFYVSSILSSPKMQLPTQEATAFIRESIPYLLGSAGTLMFDITIVAQSFIYRSRPRRASTIPSRLEEETGLLTGDSLTHPSDSTALPRGRTSRIRSTSTV